MKAPYEIPVHWNKAGSGRGRIAAMGAVRATLRARRGRPPGSGHPAVTTGLYAGNDPAGAPEPKPISQEKLDPRFRELDAAIASGRGDVRPGGGGPKKRDRR
jgi:hypothetical protein